MKDELGCLVVILALVGGAIFWFKGESKKEAQANQQAMETIAATSNEEAIRNGEDLKAWIHDKGSMTEVARDSAFAKLKGKVVILQGTVRDIESKKNCALVTLEVGKINMLEQMTVEFQLRESESEQAMKWNKKEVHALRGVVSDTGFIVDVKCKLGDVIQ